MRIYNRGRGNGQAFLLTTSRLTIFYLLFALPPVLDYKVDTVFSVFSAREFSSHIVLLSQRGMADYNSLASRLLSYYPLTPTLLSCRTAIHEQVSTIITVPPLPDALIDFVSLVLAIEISHLFGDRQLDPKNLRTFNKPEVKGRHIIGLEYTAAGSEYVISVGIEKETYEDAIESFLGVVQILGLEYLKRAGGVVVDT